jgi:SAM-dependent methyltransferase
MNKKSYKQVSEIESLHWWYVGRRLIITTQLKKIKFLSSSNILEVGSGTGGNLEMLSKFGKVYAFEKNIEALNITKSQNNHKKIRITQGSCPSKIPYSRIKFDLICLFDVLEHIADDKKTLINLKNKLKVSGKIVLTVPAYEWLFGPHDTKLHHKRRYSEKKIEAIIKDANLKIVKKSYFNSILFPLIGIVRIYEKIKGKESSIEHLMPKKEINYALLTIMKIEAFFLSFFNLPFGLSMIYIVKSR